MKNLLLLFAVVISTSSIGQTFVKMELPASMKSTLTTRTTTYETITRDVTVISKDGKVKQSAKIRMVIPDKGEGLISMEFTENILTVANIKPNYFTTINTTSVFDSQPSKFSDCIKWCNETYTDADGNKKPGRGTCKFGCWLGGTIQIMEAVASLVETIKSF